MRVCMYVWLLVVRSEVIRQCQWFSFFPSNFVSCCARDLKLCLKCNSEQAKQRLFGHLSSLWLGFEVWSRSKVKEWIFCLKQRSSHDFDPMSLKIFTHIWDCNNSISSTIEGQVDFSYFCFLQITSSFVCYGLEFHIPSCWFFISWLCKLACWGL